MNAKKAKTLRKMLRANGVNPGQASYNGPFTVAFGITLAPNSGRATYQLAKRMVG